MTPLDTISCMYDTVESIEKEYLDPHSARGLDPAGLYTSIMNHKVLLKEGENKPLVLCEFSHAMGNGPRRPGGLLAAVLPGAHHCRRLCLEWCDPRPH